MKKAIILTAILLSGCASVPTENPDAVNLAPAIADVQSASKSLNTALSSKIQAQRDQAIKAAEERLSEIATSLQTEQVQAQKVQKISDFYKKDSQTKEQKIAELENRITHLNHLLFICSAMVALIVGTIAWEFLKLVPYGAFITAGIVASAFTTAWFALGHLL